MIFGLMLECLDVLDIVCLVMLAALGNICSCLDRLMLGLGMICHVDCFRCMLKCV